MCYVFRTDQILRHAPRNSRVAAHGAYELQAPNAPGLGDPQGGLQDPMCQRDQVRAFASFFPLGPPLRTDVLYHTAVFNRALLFLRN